MTNTITPTDATTSAQDVLLAERAADQAARKVADYAEQMSTGEIEPSGEASAKFTRLVEASAVAKQAAALRAEEAKYDSALTTATDMLDGPIGSDAAVEVLAENLHLALTGQIERLRICPAERVQDDNRFKVKFNAPLTVAESGRSAVVLTSQVSGPKEIQQALAAPPVTRRSPNMVNLQDVESFATTTGTANVPRVTDFFDMILHQPLYNGSLLDPSVARVITRPDTQPWLVPSYTGRPAAAVHVDGAEITPGDFTYGNVTFNAYEYAAAHEVSKTVDLSAQDPNIIQSIWEEMLYDLKDKLNEAATVGTGSDQPTGAYTSAAAAFSGNQNRVRISVGTDPTPGLDYLTDLIGTLNNRYRQSPMMSIHLNSQFAHHLLRNTDKNFPSNNLYEWANYGPASTREIYRHLGVPVYEAPTLARVNANNAKLGVGGDFTKFWVVLRPMDIFVSEHTAASRRNWYIQVAQWMDSNVVQKSLDNNRPGPLAYIQGTT